jgi:hypothetical protein
MDTDILYFTLAALACGLALNLRLTLASLQAARQERDRPEPLQPGMPVPVLQGRALSDGRRLRVGGAGGAMVLLLLGTGCPKCAAKLPQLEALHPLAAEAGLEMWLVSQEPRWRLRRFLGTHRLARHTLRVSLADYQAVNPLLASPAYLFVNHEGVLEAGGLIGDDNWLALQAQLTAVPAPAL